MTKEPTNPLRPVTDDKPKLMTPPTYIDLVINGAERLNASPTPRLDAEVLMGAAAKLTRTELAIRWREGVSAGVIEKFASLVARRFRGEPVAYIIGRQEFYALDFEVAPGVLIPRPETELMIDWVLGHYEEKEPLRFLDIGTGSAVLAITPLCHRPLWQSVATDISEAALFIAQKNATRHHVAERVSFVLADIWPSVTPEPFDCILSNPPYVPEGDPAVAESVRLFEPQSALYAGLDGLEVIRNIAASATRWLRPGGRLLLEFGAGQAMEVAAIIGAAPQLTCDEIVPDLAGIDRVVVARKEE